MKLAHNTSFKSTEQTFINSGPYSQLPRYSETVLLKVFHTQGPRSFYPDHRWFIFFSVEFLVSMVFILICIFTLYLYSPPHAKVICLLMTIQLFFSPVVSFYFFRIISCCFPPNNMSVDMY